MPDPDHIFPGAPPPLSRPLPAAALARRRPQAVEIEADAEERTALAELFDAIRVPKFRLSGSLAPEGPEGWILTGTLGATVVQRCVVTLEPVTTRIDVPVKRRFLPGHIVGEEDAAPLEADEIDALTDPLDLGEIAVEIASLALPDYPRADGADLGSQQAAPPGVVPMTDDDARPFAALAQLRDKLSDEE